MDIELKSALDAIKGTVEGFTSRMSGIEGRIDKLDDLLAERPIRQADGTLAGAANITKQLSRGSEGLELLEKAGRVRFECGSILPRYEQKAVITSANNITPVPVGGVVPGGRFPFRLRSIFRTEPIEGGSAFVLRENAYVNNGSPQVEGTGKQESTFTFTNSTIPVETIAHYVNVTRQAWDDIVGLQIYLDNSLVWGLEREIEKQVLAGDGTSPNLVGIVGGAAAFNTSLLTPSVGWQYADVLHAAATQLLAAGYVCDTFIVNPTDWAKIERTKTTTGEYVMASPMSRMPEVLWSRQVVLSPVLSAGTFVALDSRWFHIRERMRTMVEVSYEHGTNFTSNLATVRAEVRLAFIVQRPTAAVTGSFSQSPA